jgi:hypothetical protein
MELMHRIGFTLKHKNLSALQNSTGRRNKKNPPPSHQGHQEFTKKSSATIKKANPKVRLFVFIFGLYWPLITDH